jgi:hypothetical protein
VPELVVRQAPEQLAALSKALREAGRRDLQKELRTGLRRAAVPPQAAARENYRKRLPREGGLNKRAAAARMRVVPKGGTAPAVRLIATSPSGRRLDLRAVDSGLIRHPVYQSKDRPRPPWVSQRIRAHSFADAMIETAPEARREMERAMDVVKAKIEASTEGFT